MNVKSGLRTYGFTRNLIYLFGIIFISTGWADTSYTVSPKHDVLQELGSERTGVRVGDFAFKTLEGCTHSLAELAEKGPNWQDAYDYQKPIFLPQGTKVRLVSYFDNSANNPHNPNNPPKPVGWGEKTTDEMCIAFLYYVIASEYQPKVSSISRP
jgi:hypothetical protein